MNTRFYSVLAAALALSLSAGFVAPTHAAPLSAEGQQYKLAQGHGGRHHGPDLNLTDDQKAQMKTIHQQAEQQIQGILTDDQRTTLQNAGSDWKARRQAWQQIKQSLTQAQKDQMRQIRQQAQQQIYNNVFSDVQRQQVDAWKQQHPRKNQQQGSESGS